MMTEKHEQLDNLRERFIYCGEHCCVDAPDCSKCAFFLHRGAGKKATMTEKQIALRLQRIMRKLKELYPEGIPLDCRYRYRYR
jgi:hypothetical protein